MQVQAYLLQIQALATDPARLIGERDRGPVRERMVVDIKNYIMMVNDKVRNYSCEGCRPTFSSNWQTVNHTLSRMCQKMQNGNLINEAHKNSENS